MKKVLIVAKNKETFEVFAQQLMGNDSKIIYRAPCFLHVTSDIVYYYGRLDQRCYCGIDADEAYIDGRLTIEEFESVFTEIMCCLVRSDGDYRFFNIGV